MAEKDAPTTIRITAEDAAIVRKIREKQDLKSIPLSQIVRLALRRYAESEGIRVA